MTEIQRIQTQFANAWEGDSWHGPSILEVLGALPAARASAKPIPSAHSIWEIVLHMRYVHDLVLDRLRGNPAAHSDTAAWPKIEDPSNDAWAATQGAIVVSCKALLDEMARLSDERLDQPVVDGYSSIYTTLHGLIQHDLYHAGQIAILKRSFG